MSDFVEADGPLVNNFRARIRDLEAALHRLVLFVDILDYEDSAGVVDAARAAISPDAKCPDCGVYYNVKGARHFSECASFKNKAYDALAAELAKEKGGWDAFYKLRRSVGEDRYPRMVGEVTASEREATK